MAQPPSNVAFDLPNPFTPLAFIPPKQAIHAALANYISVGCLAVLIWDILHNLRNDYRLLFKHKIKWPTVVYFVSRLSTLAYLLGKSIGLTARVDDCRKLEIVLCAFFVASHASTEFLLFLRLCAVYNWDKLVVLPFFLTWLVAVGSATTIFWGLEGIEIGPTRYCTSIIKHGYIQAAVWGEFANDTLVFIAIMFKLSTITQFPTRRPTWQSGARVSQPTTGIRRLSDVFLEDTQVYYLIAVVLNLATLITFLALDDPPTSAFRIVMIFPATVVVNIMACRVFRNLKLGYSGTTSSNKGIGSAQGSGIRSTDEGGVYIRSAHSGIRNTAAVDRSISFNFEDGHSRGFTGVEVKKVTEIVHYDSDGAIYPLQS